MNTILRQTNPMPKEGNKIMKRKTSTIEVTNSDTQAWLNGNSLSLSLSVALNAFYIVSQNSF